MSDACPLSFPFSVFPFRPGNLGLFGAPLQPPAPEKKIRARSKILVSAISKIDSSYQHVNVSGIIFYADYFGVVKAKHKC